MVNFLRGIIEFSICKTTFKKKWNKNGTTLFYFSHYNRMMNKKTRLLCL